MNPISTFFVENIVAIFFVYGQAFFDMGLALALASRRVSEFAFVRAIRPLAIFGLLHGLHEWIEMFQKIAEQTAGYTPSISHEILRLVLLALSFLMLAAFGLLLLKPEEANRWPIYGPILGLAGLWGLSVLVVAVALRPPLEEIVAIADVLARYCLGVPGALLGTWALMAQQRTFREHAMPQFGRDLCGAPRPSFFTEPSARFLCGKHPCRHQQSSIMNSFCSGLVSRCSSSEGPWPLFWLSTWCAPSMFLSWKASVTWLRPTRPN